MVVEADDVERSRAEEVVAGIGLVASRRHGTCRVEFASHVGQFLGKERVHAHLVSFFGEHVGALPEVEYEVGFLKAEGVGLGVAPLLKHLVADAPHDDAWMVAVAHHEVGQVAFVPFREVACVVVGRLLLAPHIECLVHHHQSQRVA